MLHQEKANFWLVISLVFVLTVLYFIPVRTVSGASEATQDTFPVGVYIPLAITGVVVFLLAYGAYDFIRLLTSYRKSKQMDQGMCS